MNETTLSVASKKTFPPIGICKKLIGLLGLIGLCLAQYSQQMWGSSSSVLAQQQPKQQLLQQTQHQDTLQEEEDNVGEYPAASTNNRSHTESGEESRLHTYRLCHNKKGFVGYHCEGQEYEDFADRLEAYIYQNLSLVKPPLWGKRQTPFPPNSTILLVGNSHSRQISDAFHCQWAGRDRKSTQRTYPYKGIATNGYQRLAYAIDHYPMGVTVHSLVNHPFPYSIHWKTDIEAATGLSLSSFDGIILGQFNGYDNSINTTFFYEMTEALRDRKDASLHRKAPNIRAFAKAYKGPIVGHGMFADWGIAYFKEMKRITANLNRNNIRLVNSREHISVLGEGTSSKKMGQIGECSKNAHGHRCVGSRGGHPDLMAWEVTEAVYELLDKKATSP